MSAAAKHAAQLYGARMLSNLGRLARANNLPNIHGGRWLGRTTALPAMVARSLAYEVGNMNHTTAVLLVASSRQMFWKQRGRTWV